jgi:hypothetical protein
MANDIVEAIAANEIKNGSAIVACLPTGPNTNFVNNTYVNNQPNINSIQAKYDNRFYNGIFVQLVGDQTVIGG